MKTRTVLIAAVILGVFTYSLPLYADNNSEYHLFEKTVVEIPVIGKITALTTSYLAGCKLKENTTIKMHNALLKAMADSDGRKDEMVLSDLCEKMQWTYNEGEGSYRGVSFDDLRQRDEKLVEEDDVQIDMESDQNDIDKLPKMTHKILPGKKNINGFQAREVVTQVFPEKMERPIIIKEYYTTDAKALTKIAKAREVLAEELGYGEDHTEGVPDLIKLAYEQIRKDQEWERPEGEVIRFVIKMMDADNDPLFVTNYDVMKAEVIDYQADHFSLK
ncbi:MAG: hypothetical protein K9N35_09890 [Candidatus Marinimicrobia bacterium]|nr:hypothetical protein [Candidatus Neomarinimicrobiota bacterium]